MSKVAEQYTDLDKLRHSCSHVLAQAVKRKYPTAKLGFGPPVEEGFYYDIHLPEALTDEDLKAIEAEMEKVIKSNFAFEKKMVSAGEARKIFKEKDETFKVETIDQLEGVEEISIVVDGDFTDLCKYPHAHSTGEIKAFKLTSIAGAYWKGIDTNPVMQRIYGTAFFSKKELDDFLKMREEAKKRDHRKLGKQLGLFHVQEEAPGMVFWHPRGWVIWQTIEQYMRHLLGQNGYLEVRTPFMMDRVLWEKSGHWENYQKNMFTTASENRNYAVKPMNCPGHIQIFNQGLKSYRELPFRLAEFGSCHRNEPSGVLHGIMRVRGFVQDDAHIFCTEAQIGGEASAFIDLLQKVYADFGFTEILVKLSTRPDKRIGSDEVWDRAEAALAQTLDAKGLKYELQPGEGAFYGPKIEFSLRDCLNRLWQCGTLQLDFSLPERLGAEYVGEDGKRHTPVMLHRAVLGSLERFIGILIEHHAGAFPLWLSPVQMSIIPVSQPHEAYAKEISSALSAEGFRVEVQAPTETLGARIRNAQTEKVSYMIILGDKEIEAKKISVRSRVKGDLGQTSLAEFVGKAKEEVTHKTI